jgi:integrase
MVDEGWGSVENWLGRLSPEAARNSRYVFRNWVVWVKDGGSKFSRFTPDQLVNYQAEATGRDRYAILDLAQAYIQTQHGRRGTVKHKYVTIRSFFNHNRAELPGDKTFSIKGDTPKVNGDLSPDDFRRVILSCKPVYRALYLCMLQGGMGEGEITYWNQNGWDKLREDLKTGPDIIRVDLPGRKGERNENNFYTFIGRDAIDALKLWLRERPEGSRGIFTNQFNEPLSKKAIYLYWHRHIISLGLIEKGIGPTSRGGKNPHEIRDCFRSLWEKTPAKATVAEFMMQHAVDENEYNKAYRDEAWMREEYRKAAPWLDLMSSGRAYRQVSEDRVTELERQLEEAKAAQGGRVADLEAKNTVIEAKLDKALAALEEIFKQSKPK